MEDLTKDFLGVVFCAGDESSDYYVLIESGQDYIFVNEVQTRSVVMLERDDMNGAKVRLLGTAEVAELEVKYQERFYWIKQDHLGMVIHGVDPN